MYNNVSGSNLVPDEALQRACYVVRFLFADRRDLRESYYKNFGRFAIMSVNEVITCENGLGHGKMGVLYKI